MCCSDDDIDDISDSNGGCFDKGREKGRERETAP